MNEFHLLIDDIRNLDDMDLIARTYNAGVSCLIMLSVTHLYLDHDLGEDQTGYDILKFMADHVLYCKGFKNIMPSFIQLVTANPVGKENMKNLLISEGYSTKDGHNFYK